MCADGCCQAVYSPVLDEFPLSTPTLAATGVQRFTLLQRLIRSVTEEVFMPLEYRR